MAARTRRHPTRVPSIPLRQRRRALTPAAALNPATPAVACRPRQVCRAPKRSGGAAPASTRTATPRQRTCVRRMTPAPPIARRRWRPRTVWRTTLLRRRRVRSSSLPWLRRWRDLCFRRWTTTPPTTTTLTTRHPTLRLSTVRLPRRRCLHRCLHAARSTTAQGPPRATRKPPPPQPTLQPPRPSSLLPRRRRWWDLRFRRWTTPPTTTLMTRHPPLHLLTVRLPRRRCLRHCFRAARSMTAQGPRRSWETWNPPPPPPTPWPLRPSSLHRRTCWGWDGERAKAPAPGQLPVPVDEALLGVPAVRAPVRLAVPQVALDVGPQEQ